MRSTTVTKYFIRLELKLLRLIVLRPKQKFLSTWKNMGCYFGNSFFTGRSKWTV